MNRRNFNLALGASFLAAVTMPRALLACACGGSVNYRRLDPSDINAYSSIEEMFNQELGTWSYANESLFSIQTQDIAENAREIPISIELKKLPAEFLACRAIKLFIATQTKLYRRSSAGEYLDPINYTLCVPVAGVEAESLPHAKLRTRYSSPVSGATLYVGAKFAPRDNPTESVALVMPAHPGSKTVSCDSTLYYFD